MTFSQKYIMCIYHIHFLLTSADLLHLLLSLSAFMSILCDPMSVLRVVPSSIGERAFTGA